MVGAARVVLACDELERACADAESVTLGSATETLREAMHGLAQRLQA